MSPEKDNLPQVEKHGLNPLPSQGAAIHLLHLTYQRLREIQTGDPKLGVSEDYWSFGVILFHSFLLLVSVFILIFPLMSLMQGWTKEMLT